jgi:hypothetical protein
LSGTIGKLEEGRFEELAKLPPNNLFESSHSRVILIQLSGSKPYETVINSASLKNEFIRLRF